MDAEQQDGSRHDTRAEERQRLALYLHDSIGQFLCLTKLHLTRIEDALRHPIDSDRRAWLQTMVQSLIPEIETAIRIVQEKILEFDVPIVSEVCVSTALEEQCISFFRRTGIRCDRHFESFDLEAGRRSLVVFIVREALSNVARHSGATKVDVSLQRSCERGILTVCDNGTGMDVTKLNTIRSIGLRGMQERAVALGGNFAVDSTPNEGTRITITFPLRLP